MQVGRTISVLVALALAAGCSGGEDTSSQAESSAGGVGGQASGAQAAAMDIAIFPAPDSKGVDPATEVKVTGSGGRLDEVRVTDGAGRELKGAYAPDRSSWAAAVPVREGTKYAVHAWGTAAGGAKVEKVGRFTTTNIKSTGSLEIADVQPADGDTVGVAHPLMVTFSQPVADRATVQDALEVTTTPPVAGAWYWIDDVSVDYRPEQFWPAGTKVELSAKLKDVTAGDGVTGSENVTSAFTVGRSQILQVDVDKHTLAVVRDGRPIKSYEVSTGKKGWETRNGIKIIMAKQRGKTWTNEAIDAKREYRYRSKYAMRITNSGEFLHDAPWNTGNIGEANTSHGCIGLTPKSMVWLYKNTLVGDPVVVTGSPKPFDDLTNRVADWNVDWAKWSAGNTAG